MAYEHDVFLSYKRGFPFGEWVQRHFLPFFSSYVEGALNRPLKVFVDTSGVATGDSWPQRLQRALGHSRCLVAIWSPQYFHSEWCRRECATMLYREERLGLRTVGNPGGLVLPVCVFDGEHFPERTREIQYFNCNDYFLVGEGFTRAPEYVRFQQEMKAWAVGVAEAIRRAPRWRKSWLSPKWLDQTGEDLYPRPMGNFPLSGLE